MEEKFYSECGKYKIVIEDGEEPDSPLDDDFYNAITFVVYKRTGCLILVDNKKVIELDDFSDVLEDYASKIEELGKENVRMVYAYSHGGVSLNIFGPVDKWDSFRFGFLIYNKNDHECANLTPDKIEEYFKEYIDAWNHYLNETDYNYFIHRKRDLYDKDGNLVTYDWICEGSCCKYVSRDYALSDAIDEAKLIAKSHGDIITFKELEKKE